MSGVRTTLLYYKPTALASVASAEFPGTVGLSHFFQLYDAGSIPVDRTGTIRTPVNVHTLFPVPSLRPIRKTFEDICNERAAEIIAKARELDTRIYVLWSGGIDSTLVLVSLLKSASADDHERITVLMSEDSINENPNFYREHLRGQLALDTSTILPYIIGSDAILVSGEHNDQLFGSDMMAKLILRFGTSVIHEPYRRERLFEHFENALTNERVSNAYLDMFERLRQASPIPLVSTFDFIWWVNFTLKWQTVYTRMLTFVSPRNVTGITPEYVRNRYFPFFNSEDFQLWSMNNQDKKIKDEWRTYKWVCKDIIYDFTKDDDYRANKVKRGSLVSFMRSHEAFKFLDIDFKLHRELEPESYYVPGNDFIVAEPDFVAPASF